MKTLFSLFALMAISMAANGAAFDPVYRRVNATASGIQDVIIAPPPANTFTIRGLTNGLAYEVVVSDGLKAQDISGQWYLWVDGADLVAAQPGVFATPADLTPYALTTYVDDQDDLKSDVGHGHAISDVSGLQTALDGKAPTSHSHIISDTTGLQAALDGKSSTSHNHDATYAAIGHNHNGVYATVSHTHTTNDLSQVNAHLANIVSLIPAPRKSFATNVTTSAAGTFTWTFPSAFTSTPVITVTVFDAATGVFYNERVTARSTTATTISVSQSTSVTILGIGVLTLPTTAATAVSIRAEEQH